MKETRDAARWLVVALLTFALAVPLRARGDEPAGSEVILEPGKTVRGDIAGGEKKVYRLDLEADDFVTMTVGQHGVDVAAELRGPDGTVVVRRDWEHVRVAPEHLMFITTAAGAYRLEIQAAEAEPAGHFTVRCKRTHPATAKERVIVADRSGVLEQLEQLRDAFRASGDRIGEALALHRLGDRQWQQGQDEAGLASLEAARALFREGSSAEGEVDVVTSLGDRLRHRGETAAALAKYREALSLAEGLAQPGLVAHLCTKLGMELGYTGDLEGALAFFGRARSFYARDADTLDEIIVMGGMSRVLHRLGQVDQALAYAEESRALAEKNGLDHLTVGILMEIGDLQRARGDLLSARDTYHEAARHAGLTKDATASAIVRNSMAALMLDVPGAMPGAGPWREMALTIAYEGVQLARRLHEESPAVSDWLESESDYVVGRALHSLGRLDDAARWLAAALALRERQKERLSLADVLVELAGVERDRGRLQDALARAQAAVDLVEELRDKVTDTELRSSFVAGHADAYTMQAAILMRLHRRAPRAGHDAAALHVSERAHARVLLEALATAGVDVHAGADPALLDRERAAQAALREASALLARTSTDDADVEARAAAEKAFAQRAEDLRQIKEQIERASPGRAALTQAVPATLDEIRREVLDDDTVVLEFLLGPERGDLWAVTRTELIAVPQPSAIVVERAARPLLDLLTARQRESSAAAIARADKRLAAASARLATLLLGPLDARLSGAWRHKRLLIVPSGALAYVPFGIFPAATRSPRRLADEHEIVYAPSASVVLSLRREPGARPSSGARVAVVADPVFEASDPRVHGETGPTATAADAATPALDPPALRAARSLGRAGFARLPFSRREAAAIAAEGPSGGVLQMTDFSATRARVTEGALADAHIVHFATHGVLETQSPSLSGLVLSLVDEKGHPQDGFLRLPEIYTLHLRADLVVLSGCQTALGRDIRAEGLVGLTRGFLYAGARGVVASLWQVDDESTSELMKRFYHALLSEHRPPAEALRAAQRAMAGEKRWSAPFYWAGFILQGDWKLPQAGGGTVSGRRWGVLAQGPPHQPPWPGRVCVVARPDGHVRVHGWGCRARPLGVARVSARRNRTGGRRPPTPRTPSPRITSSPPPKPRRTWPASTASATACAPTPRS